MEKKYNRFFEPYTTSNIASNVALNDLTPKILYYPLFILFIRILNQFK